MTEVRFIMYNILICDDEKDIVSALSIYLSTENYNIFPAYTGQEALDIVAKHDIHLILMDIMMPQMDGIAATAKLRETSNIPIILLTAKSEDTDKILGLNMGADDYITKPFNPIEDIVFLIDEACDQFRFIDCAGGTSHELMSLGKFCLQKSLRIIDGTDGGKGIGAQMRTNQEGLRVIVADAADAAGTAFKINQIMLKFGTEGCVFDIVNLPLKACFLAVECHTAFFCAEVGMVVNTEENIEYTVLLTCYAKKTAHDVPPIMYRIELFIKG